jgi:hypothetical protein
VFARCLLRQWALRSASTSRSTESEPAWHAYIYDVTPHVHHWMPQSPRQKDPRDTSGYPHLAKRFAVEGKTVVEVTLNDAGVVQGSRVVARRVTVPGIEGVRAVAFETVFDDASLGRVKSMAHESPKPEQLKEGVARRRIELVWKLQ